MSLLFDIINGQSNSVKSFYLKFFGMTCSHIARLMIILILV